MTQESPQTQVLLEAQVWRKLDFLEGHLHNLLRGEAALVPTQPGRDVQIVAQRELPPKKGFSSIEGQCRLLHDLASIELQAMELGVRSLIEYPEAPPKFRAELAAVTLEEGKHLRLCLEAMEALGMPWGSFPAHNALWLCVSPEDSLLDRIVIVHRYLEGSGLDATTTILRRLIGIGEGAAETFRAIKVISEDEVAHVQFGSRWYHALVREAGLDPAEDFRSRLVGLFSRIPRRSEPINEDLRRLAGFTESEVTTLLDFRKRV